MMTFHMGKVKGELMLSSRPAPPNITIHHCPVHMITVVVGERSVISDDLFVYLPLIRHVDLQMEANRGIDPQQKLDTRLASV